MHTSRFWLTVVGGRAGREVSRMTGDCEVYHSGSPGAGHRYCHTGRALTLADIIMIPRPVINSTAHLKLITDKKNYLNEDTFNTWSERPAL